MAVRTPYIPEKITVHLGAPASNAENVTVPFADYIKNVASSEIYLVERIGRQSQYICADFICVKPRVS